MSEIVIRVEGIEVLAKAIRALADAMCAAVQKEPTDHQNTAVQQAPIQQLCQALPTAVPGISTAPSVVPTPATLQSQAPVQGAFPMASSLQPQAPVQGVVPTATPVQPQTPVQEVVPMTQMQPQAPIQSAAPQVPTTAAPQQYSFDQLAVALSNLCTNMHKQGEVHNLLNRFGVQALFDLPKEKYGEFATAMRSIGGVI